MSETQPYDVCLQTNPTIDGRWKIINNWCDMTAQILSPDGFSKPYLKDLFCLDERLVEKPEIRAHYALFEVTSAKGLAVELRDQLAQQTHKVADDPEVLKKRSRSGPRR